MKRRDFISTSVTAAASSAFFMRSRASLRAPEQEQPHPLYFDGLTILSGNKEDLKKSGLSGFIWDVSAGKMIEGKFVRELAPSLKSLAQTHKFLRDNDRGLFLATKGSQVRQGFDQGKVAVFLQFQGAEPITADLEVMDAFYEFGLRILQLTHHYGNIFSGGCLVKDWTGLTELGFRAVEKMNALGIVPDLSHGNELMALDVLKTSKKPVIISHTGCRALVNNARCAPDSVIRGVADSGGVVGIFAMSFWLTTETVPTVDSYIAQLEHVIKVGGIDSVGISNDFPIAGDPGALSVKNDNAKAVQNYFPWWKQHAGVLGFDELPKHCVIPELNSVRRFFTIQTALEKKGYESTVIEKIMGGNWVRVLTESLG